MAYNQLQALNQTVSDTHISEDKDIWQYSWGKNFSSSRAYKIMMGHTQHHTSIQWIWKTPCQPKHKLFFWLVLKDRLSTRNILRRRNMFLPSYNCVLCGLETEETVQHLFLQCQFAKECWHILQIHIPSDVDFPEVMHFLRDALQSQFYMAAIILMSWAIWTSRSACIFNGLVPSVDYSRSTFYRDRVSTRHSQLFDQWLHLIS
ncbi:uncharacterized protein [Miscanthus floridulus]|uniref:uncharacterized protein n=1 Tax=Miscanthus floridulus TaxID=154761 RepID=UPI003457DA5B